MIRTEKELLDYVMREAFNYDAIVVEGYDGVGKGRVLTVLSDALGVTPYRPDYNLWQKYDLRPEDRWKISGFFWDILSHFDVHPTKNIMLFDRGVISGAVYNNDERISEDYYSLLRGMKVLHIYVTCTLKDYTKFQTIRGVDTDLGKFLEYESRYYENFTKSGADFIIYQNRYDQDISQELSMTCQGCGHYSYGICRHPSMNSPVDPKNQRCEHSRDKEVQDIVR